MNKFLLSGHFLLRPQGRPRPLRVFVFVVLIIKRVFFINVSICSSLTVKYCGHTDDFLFVVVVLSVVFVHFSRLC